MKHLSKVLVACLLVTVIAVPAALFADQMLAPRDIIIFPGVTTVEYGGHTLTFTTNTQLKAKFQQVGNTIELRVKATYGTSPGGASASSSNPQVVIVSETLDEVVYDGSAEEWIELDLTEGGFTEK